MTTTDVCYLVIFAYDVYWAGTNLDEAKRFAESLGLNVQKCRIQTWQGTRLIQRFAFIDGQWV